MTTIFMTDGHAGRRPILVGGTPGGVRRLAVIALFACGGGGGPSSSDPPAPAPVAKPVAPPVDAAAPAFCFPARGALSRFAADDRGATLCVAADRTTCASVDFATGVFGAASAPPAEPGGADVRVDDAGAVSLCTGGGDTCTPLALIPLAAPPDGGPPPHYDVSLAADGKTAVASVPATTKPVVVLDAVTGKELAKWSVGEGKLACIGVVRFVGATIYASAGACEGIGAKAWIYTPAGAKLGALDVRGGAPVRVSGTTWAVAALDGGTTLFDATTGGALRTLAPPPARGAVLGAPAEWIASPLVRTPAGKLALASAGAISLVDPATGTVEHSYSLPACKR